MNDVNTTDTALSKTLNDHVAFIDSVLTEDYAKVQREIHELSKKLEVVSKSVKVLLKQKVWWLTSAEHIEHILGVQRIEKLGEQQSQIEMIKKSLVGHKELIHEWTNTIKHIEGSYSSAQVQHLNNNISQSISDIEKSADQLNELIAYQQQALQFEVNKIPLLESIRKLENDDSRGFGGKKLSLFAKLLALPSTFCAVYALTYLSGIMEIVTTFPLVIFYTLLLVVCLLVAVCKLIDITSHKLRHTMLLCTSLLIPCIALMYIQNLANPPEIIQPMFALFGTLVWFALLGLCVYEKYCSKQHAIYLEYAHDLELKLLDIKFQKLKRLHGRPTHSLSASEKHEINEVIQISKTVQYKSATFTPIIRMYQDGEMNDMLDIQNIDFSQQSDGEKIEFIGRQSLILNFKQDRHFR